MAEDLSSTIEDAATEGVASVTSDGQSVTARSIPDLIAADTYLKGTTAVTGPAIRGGAVSGWGKLRAARAVPQGGGPE